MATSTLFKDTFESKLLDEIDRYSVLHKATAGTIILESGNQVHTIPLLIKGSLKVSRIEENGRELFLYYIQAGETCAMTFTCCMQENPSEVRVIAEESVEWLAIPIQYMDQWLSRYPSWKSFVMRTIRNRFNELLDTIDQIAFQKLDDRLILYLQEKSKHTKSSIITSSHEQIALDMATSRVVVSRLLKTLENDKKILIYRGQIKLLEAFFDIR